MLSIGMKVKAKHGFIDGKKIKCSGVIKNIIFENTDTPEYGIEWEEKLVGFGHECNGTVKQGHGRYAKAEELILINIGPDTEGNYW